MAGRYWTYTDPTTGEQHRVPAGEVYVDKKGKRHFGMAVDTGYMGIKFTTPPESWSDDVRRKARYGLNKTNAGHMVPKKKAGRPKGSKTTGLVHRVKK